MIEQKNIDIKNFSKVVGVSVATINRKLDEFSHLRIGRRVLFNDESVRDFTERFTQRPKSNNSQLSQAR
jgi:DeoR/GlpR family transcriptional regulator of sugar metabolism